MPPNGILLGAKFTLHPSFAFSYIGSVTAWHFSSGIRQTLQQVGTRNGITKLSQMAPPIWHGGHQPTFLVFKIFQSK